MARKATGSLEWRARLKTWVGRVRGEDGQRSPWLSLETTSEEVARERLAKWIATGKAPSQAGRETFEDAATRLVDAVEKTNPVLARDRRTRLRQFAYPHIGAIAVADLTMPTLFGVLESMATDGYCESTIHHMRTDFSRICSKLVLEGAIEHNCARGMQLPDEMVVDDRIPCVLTDEETIRLQKERGFTAEIDMLSLVSRYLGGQRTSDLHAFDWSGVDTVSWKTARVRRPKTETRKRKRRGQKRATRAYEWVLHEIPARVIEPLKAWWQKQGSPKEGPVFPLRRGRNAGQRKTGSGICYSEPLREIVWGAGIHRPLPGYESAMGDERRKFCSLQVGIDRETSERTGLPEMRPLEFHSWRRAYVTALSRAGVGHLEAMALSGHTDVATHAGYYAPTVLAAPAAALPGEAQSAAAALPPVPPPVAPPPAPLPTTPAEQVAPSLAAVLEQLATLLRGAGQTPAIDPGLGSMVAPAVPSEIANPAGFMQRAQKDSNLRPMAPEAINGLPSTHFHPDHGSDVGGISSPSAVALTRDLGQSPERPLGLDESLLSPSPAVADHPTGHTNSDSSSPGDNDTQQTKPVGAPAPGAVITTSPSQLELLRATARAAVDAGNWALLDSLRPLIEAEERRPPPTAPISLALVRAKKEAGK